MKKMIYFELKKIYNRKFNVAAMLAGYFLIVFCAASFLWSADFWDEDTQTYVRGIRAFEVSEEKNGPVDALTEESVTALVRDIQEKHMDLESDGAYLAVIRPMNDLLHVICSNYMEIGEIVDWNRLNEISTENGVGFYERRIEKVSEFLNQDFSYGNYSEQEKSYWMEKEREVQTPFRWGYKPKMDIAWDTIQIAFYLIFVLAVCVSPIFASEYESGASALLLTTRHGKTRLVYAKILAALFFSLGYVAVGIGMGLAVIGVAVGFSGANLPVQLWGTVIPYDWTVGTACLVTFLVMLLVTLTFTLFALLLSSRVKGSLATLVVGFVVLTAPAFFPMSKESRLWNHINYLFPVRVMSVKDVLATLNSYPIGPLVFSYLGMAVLVYLAVGLVCFLGIRGGFARHQVRG